MQFLMKRHRTTCLETSTLSVGAIRRAAGAAAVEAYIWVPKTERELSKSLRSFKGRGYLRWDAEIWKGENKRFLLTEQHFSIIYHLYFGLHKDHIFGTGHET